MCTLEVATVRYVGCAARISLEGWSSAREYGGTESFIQAPLVEHVAVFACIVPVSVLPHVQGCIDGVSIWSLRCGGGGAGLGILLSTTTQSTSVFFIIPVRVIFCLLLTIEGTHVTPSGSAMTGFTRE